MELDEKLGSGPFAVGLSPSGNPERDLKNQWTVILSCIVIMPIPQQCARGHTHWKTTPTAKSP